MDMMTMGVSFLTATPTAADSLMSAIGSSLESIVGFFGTVINALLTTDGALAPLWPLVGIAVGFGLFRGGVGLVARFTPGL